MDVKKLAIATFLVLGTLLSLCLAIDGIVHPMNYVTLRLRTGIFGYFIIFDFLLAFPLSGLISTYSYFTRGQLWKPLTKAIIINIYIWLAFFLFTFIKNFIFDGFTCIAIILIMISALGLIFLWKAINSVNEKAN
jgi:hypothetical protein